MDKLIEAVEKSMKTLVNLKTEEYSKERKRILANNREALLVGCDFLKTALFGGAVGAGALGHESSWCWQRELVCLELIFFDKAGTILAKMGLFGAIAQFGIIGTIGDSLIAWSNSETWKASDTKKMIGSILGGQGGGWSAAFRGVTGAVAGFKIGAALFILLVESSVRFLVDHWE